MGTNKLEDVNINGNRFRASLIGNLDVESDSFLRTNMIIVGFDIQCSLGAILCPEFT